MSAAIRSFFNAAILTRLGGFTPGVSEFRLIALALALAATGSVSTKGQDLFGEPTNLRSTSHGMISDRFQRHSWFTSDGALHLLIRTTETVPSLRLFRAQDSTFSSFALEREFKGSGSQSTSDGVLINDTLYVIYDTDAGQIVFAVLAYANSNWTLQSASVLNQDAKSAAARPSLAIEPGGRIWVGYTLESSTGVYGFRVCASDDKGQSWTASDAQCPAPAANQERVVRLLAGASRVYAVYSDRHTFGLCVREDSVSDRNSGWANQGTFFTQSRFMGDPYGTHFSAVTDLDGNLHFLSNNGNRAGIYMRYGKSWSSPVVFSSSNARMRAAYMEIATDKKGRLLAVFSATNGQRDCLIAFNSLDNGDTWRESGVLMPLRVDTRNARLEMPALLRAPQPVFQQVSLEDGHDQSLVSYIVPWSLDSPISEK